MDGRIAFRARSAVLVVLAAPWLCSGIASAEDSKEPAPAQDESTGEPNLVPPVLEEYIKADYPEEALAAGIEAAVLAEIDVDESGLVTDVRVKEPAGQGFDEAAVAAMSRFVFRPALLGQTPIAATVLYRYTFFLSEPSTASTGQAQAEPAAAHLLGRVETMESAPLPGAKVSVVRLSGQGEMPTAGCTGEPPPFSLTAQGAFEAAKLCPGTYSVDVVADGYKTYSTVEELNDGETREVLYRLELESSIYEAVVRGRKPPREVTRREISRREITRIPGTGGDALRAVQNMPGMARAAGISGALIVRGSSPGDSRYFFDELTTPLLYHFGGLTSIINSDLLERIDFFPGNYDVRYSGATGGIVEVTPRAPATDRFHAYLDLDLWDAGALVETPIGEHFSVAVSGRRSYIDLLLNAMVPDSGGGFSFVVAPRYYDYQLIADYHPSKKNNVRLFCYGSSDKLVFVTGEDVGENPNFSGRFNFGVQFHQLQLRYDHRFSKGVTNSLNVGSGIWLTDASFGPQMTLDWTTVPIMGRNELEIDVKKHATVRVGFDVEAYWNRYTFRAPDIFAVEGESFGDVTGKEDLIETTAKRWELRPGWYAQLELRPIEPLRLIAGVRVDYYTVINELGLDPRLVARWEIVPGTTLKGGLGLFHQYPGDSVETLGDFGNPNLELVSAVHYSLGAEQRLWENIEVGVEGFYKDLSNLVVSSQALVKGQPERYSNEGTGKVYGLEFLIKHRPTDRFFGWISYTLMRSKRVDHPGDAERLFDFDQTHILTIVASAVLGRGWEAGLRFRLASGNPDTPVVGSVYDADADIYMPVYGRVNSERLPMFHQLDLRVDKNWKLKHLKVVVYVDVQNIYNQKNPEGYDYQYDYSHRVYFRGLPLVPSLGLKLEY
ncbi:MAG: TonB-dependent receptor [Myxococcota bacterium]|jgi:TonB family protein|nr:TonB-dependent receptor [Myxococcota bacterium]